MSILVRAPKRSAPRRRVNRKKALQLFREIRASLAKNNYPLKGKTMEEIVRIIKRQREEYWEEKFARRS